MAWRLFGTPRILIYDLFTREMRILMKQILALAAFLLANTVCAVTDTNELIFNRLKSPASVCIQGDPCSEEVSKVLTDNTVAAPKNGDNTVKMLNTGIDGTMVFEPAILKIAVGESVTFVPTDGGHNSASVPGLVPDGAEGWQGNMSEKIEVRFDREGIYIYQCTPHVMMAMIGVVTVGNPTNLKQIVANSKELEQSFIMNNDRLSGYLAAIK